MRWPKDLRRPFHAACLLLASAAVLLMTPMSISISVGILGGLACAALIVGLFASPSTPGARALMPAVMIIAVVVLAHADVAILRATSPASPRAEVPGWLLLVVTIAGSRLLAIDSGMRFAVPVGRGAITANHIPHQTMGSSVLLGTGLTILFRDALAFWSPHGADPALRMVLAALNGATFIHHAIILLFFVIVAALGEQAWCAAARRQKPSAPHDSQHISADHADQVARKFIRGLVPMLPLLGFLGTVIGLAQAMADLPRGLNATGAPDFTATLAGLSIKFETTLLGLLTSMIASFLLALLEKFDADQAIRQGAQSMSRRTTA